MKRRRAPIAALALGVALAACAPYIETRLTSEPVNVARPAEPAPTAEPTWLQVCNTGSLLYAAGRNGAFVRSDTALPPGVRVVAVRFDGDRDVGHRDCVSYKIDGDATVGAGAVDLTVLTPGQPMFADAVDEARRSATLIELPETLAFERLKRQHPARWWAWRDVAGDDRDFWLYLIAAGQFREDEWPDRTVETLKSQGRAFWTQVQAANRLAETTR